MPFLRIYLPQKDAEKNFNRSSMAQDMAASRWVGLKYSNRSHEDSVKVIALNSNKYRLESTPLLQYTDSELLYYGDIIEAEYTEDCLLLVKIIERAKLTHLEILVRVEVLDTVEFQIYLDSIIAMGGFWEKVFGGLLIAHVPQENDFDLWKELQKVYAVVEKRKANFTEVPHQDSH